MTFDTARMARSLAIIAVHEVGRVGYRRDFRGSP
jgi:hypothetical protein